MKVKEMLGIGNEKDLQNDLKGHKFEYVAFFVLKESDTKRRMVGHFILYEEIPSADSLDYNKKEVIEDDTTGLLKDKTVQDLEVFIVHKESIEAVHEMLKLSSKPKYKKGHCHVKRTIKHSDAKRNRLDKEGN